MSRRFLQRQYDIRGGEENASRHRCEERRMLRLLEMTCVKDAIERVRQIPRSRALETSIKKESHRIPFVITFNPALSNIPQVISSNLNILRSSQRCLEAFSSPPHLSYRRCKNLRDILVRA